MLKTLLPFLYMSLTESVYATQIQIINPILCKKWISCLMKIYRNEDKILSESIWNGYLLKNIGRIFPKKNNNVHISNSECPLTVVKQQNDGLGVNNDTCFAGLL